MQFSDTIVMGLAGGMLFSAYLTFCKFRLHSLLQTYALSSAFLVAISIYLAQFPPFEHLYLAGAISLLVKVIGVPHIITRIMRRSSVSPGVASNLRPAPSYFMGAVIIAIAGAVAWQLDGSQFFWALESSRLSLSVAAVAVALVLLGTGIMITRRNIFAQIIGFLTLENGIALFTMVTLGGVPLLLEVVMYFVIIIGALLMASLSQGVQRLYATADTKVLNDLVDHV